MLLGSKRNNLFIHLNELKASLEQDQYSILCISKALIFYFGKLFFLKNTMLTNSYPRAFVNLQGELHQLFSIGHLDTEQLFLFNPTAQQQQQQQHHHHHKALICLTQMHNRMLFHLFCQYGMTIKNKIG
ncbi:hypothetical protein T4B_14598 [Trichinella pseudospiralis]|uniref:Uncharacterized protein n=1 Tax=Trichinella pseudospiralis TaxID=6337 RepID=A0A0V1ILE6_TRIPS|nr:hypothetical protein T4B_14598 [Trichinella pseudospiralis]